MKFEDDDIFINVDFRDAEGYVYAKIHESEIDGETFVITTDGSETRQNVIEKANEIMKFLNDAFEVKE